MSAFNLDLLHGCVWLLLTEEIECYVYRVSVRAHEEDLLFKLQVIDLRAYRARCNYRFGVQELWPDIPDVVLMIESVGLLVFTCQLLLNLVS